jgi:hypothetical protein
VLFSLVIAMKIRPQSHLKQSYKTDEKGMVAETKAVTPRFLPVSPFLAMPCKILIYMLYMHHGVYYCFSPPLLLMGAGMGADIQGYNANARAPTHIGQNQRGRDYKCQTYQQTPKSKP